MSVCIISDCLKHDTTAVHAFISRLMPHLKEELPAISKIVYFSDGAASQYKNYKNFANLCHHKNDHAYEAEWNFFATSHGKSPCDGLGGTIKRLVARASLQAVTNNQILTPSQMFTWANQNIKGIKFFYVSSDDVQANAEQFQLEDRFSSSKTVSGTRSHHSFVPVSSSKLEMRRLSTDDGCTIVTMGDTAVEATSTNYDKYQPGKYVACMYDQDWYIGYIEERSDEHRDVFIKFMKRSLNKTLSWPQQHDECHVPFQDLICTISTPEVKGQSGRQYTLSSEDYKYIQEYLSSSKS